MYYVKREISREGGRTFLRHTETEIFREGTGVKREVEGRVNGRGKTSFLGIFLTVVGDRD